MTLADPIYFPDAVAAVLDYLRTRSSLTGVPLRQTVPNPRPATFVIVQRTGGARRHLVVDDAYLTVEAWAPTEAEAHDIAQTVRAELHAAQSSFLTGSVFCYRVDEVGGLAMQPDPESARPRYIWTASVSLRNGPV